MLGRRAWCQAADIGVTHGTSREAYAERRDAMDAALDRMERADRP